MISFAALGRFAAEFLALLVAAGGLALVGLRPELLSGWRGSRAAMAVGFSALAGVSFVEGSLIVQDRSNPALVAVRCVGLLAVLVGTQRWSGDHRSQRLMWLGLGATLVASGLFASGVGSGADVALGIGAAAFGLALRIASSRSIAARVAASSAVILLLVVLVLSVSLSAVLSTTVRDDAGRRLDARAAAEADFAQKTQPETAVVIARNVALTFATNASFQAATNELVSSPNPNTGVLPGNQPAVFKSIQQYLAPGLALAYINTSGHEYAQAGPPGFDQGVVAAAIGSEDVKQAFADPTGGQRSSVQVFGSTAFVVAAQTVARQKADQTVDYPTAVVAVELLDNNFLANEREPIDPHVSLALVSRSAVLATAGSPGPKNYLLDLAQRTLATDQPIAITSGNGLLSSTRPLHAGNQAIAVLVASTPATVVTDVRNKLLRTLFVLAMAGTLLALALAAYSGERVSGGIRILTQAAHRIQTGDYTELPVVSSPDEVGVLGTAFDSMARSILAQTTALQRAAEEETALRNQLEAVVAGMGEALVAVNAAGRITLFNRAAEELLGLDSGEVEGELLGDVLVAEAEDGSALAARLQRPSPSRWSAVATVATELGPRIPVGISSGPLRGPDGAVAGAVLVLRDLRPEREVDRIKSEFLSRIGHELRTPLTGILGYAEILLRRDVPEARARDMHQQIVDAGRRLYRVVQMLEFSAAAEAGRTLLRSETVDVRAVVDDVVSGWTERLRGEQPADGARPVDTGRQGTPAGAKTDRKSDEGRRNHGHTLTRRVPRNLPAVRGDRRWLGMAIDELIDNAVKFSPDGGRVTVNAATAVWAADDEDRPAIRVTVADEGVGLTEREQGDVFGDFVQGDASDTRRFGGLGLGLSLVKRVAEAHGGVVEVQSTPRKGSKFSIVIPALTIQDGE